MVDLPLPLVPTSAQLVPAGTLSEAPCTAAQQLGQPSVTVGMTQFRHQAPLGKGRSCMA